MFKSRRDEEVKASYEGPEALTCMVLVLCTVRADMVVTLLAEGTIRICEKEKRIRILDIFKSNGQVFEKLRDHILRMFGVWCMEDDQVDAQNW